MLKHLRNWLGLIALGSVIYAAPVQAMCGQVTCGADAEIAERCLAPELANAKSVKKSWLALQAKFKRNNIKNPKSYIEPSLEDYLKEFNQTSKNPKCLQSFCHWQCNADDCARNPKLVKTCKKFCSEISLTNCLKAARKNSSGSDDEGSKKYTPASKNSSKASQKKHLSYDDAMVEEDEDASEDISFDDKMYDDDIEEEVVAPRKQQRAQASRSYDFDNTGPSSRKGKNQKRVLVEDRNEDEDDFSDTNYEDSEEEYQPPVSKKKQQQANAKRSNSSASANVKRRNSNTY